MTVLSKSRRQFIKNSSIAAGGLSLGISLSACSDNLEVTAAVAGNSDVTAWLNIDTTGIITIRVPSSEMGQGVHTSLPMIIADELDANWDDVRSETAPVTSDFVNALTGSRGTGGSSAVRRWWPSIAVAGATAREMLVLAAAQNWNVPTDELTTQNSTVMHEVSGQSASYASLAASAALMDAPANPRIKDPSQYTIIGKSAKRLDTPSKVNGSAVFGIDVKVPNMVYATSSAAPNYIGTLQSMNEDSARNMSGVIDVIRLPLTDPEADRVQGIVSVGDTVAVVAETYWQARKGLETLSPEFSDANVGAVDNQSLLNGFRLALSEGGKVARNDGDVEQSFAGADQIIEADYAVPYLAHLCMEPMNCTAQYKVDSVNGDSVELWAPTQGESLGIQIISEAFGIPAENVTIHTTMLGGGFGRRYEADFLLQSTRISKAVGKPVKMLWSREEDVQHDYYRPASVSRFKVAIDDSGLPVAWKNEMACPSVAQRNFSAAVVDGIDPFSLEGAVNIPYAIPNQLVTLKQHDTHIPVGSWRSVGSSHNGYYIESMLDEVATSTGQDPFALRRRLLQGHPRFLKVLDELEAKSDWLENAPEGRFRGMAIHESFASIVGEVAEISIDDNDGVRIHKMTCVADCGVVVNPSIIESQMESAMIDGLTAALRGGITIKQGRVVEGNFDTYQMMRLAEMPQLAVHIMKNSEAAGGVGEPAVPPSMPALTNAIFAASGKRVRSLPIEKDLTSV